MSGKESEENGLLRRGSLDLPQQHERLARGLFPTKDFDAFPSSLIAFHHSLLLLLLLHVAPFWATFDRPLSLTGWESLTRRISTSNV